MKRPLFARWTMTMLLVTIISSAACFVAPAQSQTTTSVYEAEDGVLTGTTVATSRSGYSGTGYVTGFDMSGDGVKVTVTAATTGLYNLTIRYAGPYGDKYNDLYTNGEGQGQIYFPSTTTFTDLAPVKVWLNAGSNTVEIRNSWGWIELDAFKLAKAPPRPPLSVPNTLVNPNASQAARRLMTYLADNYGKQIIAGQDDIGSARWIEQNTGKKPALLGVDLMDYSPSRVERGTTSHTVEDAIAWWQGGGIVSIQWHWNAPSGLIDQPGKEWWRGFYTDATTFDVAAALANPSSPEYALLLRDIDAIAVQLTRLRDANVPVLWRPLHEAQGGWFWWGARGPQPAVQLYLLMYDRLTNYHGLNNLIWVWTSADTPSALEWYPGDQVVDIIGADIYLAAGSHSASLGTFDRLVELYGGRKLVTMSENGAMPDPDRLQGEGAGWSWFMTWGTMVEDQSLNDLAFVRRVYAHPYVITLDELPDLQSGPTATATPTRTPVPPTATRTPVPPTATRTATPVAGTCQVIYKVVSQWGNGFIGDVTIKHSGAALSSWTLTWSFGGNQQITNAWNTTLTQSGAQVTARNTSWNGGVASGATVNFGFQASYSGTNSSPVDFRFNGVRCST